ncbi:hypothetical protein [Nodularia sp. UHCC 0506]|uniref:hypothetical protein n=1 Tax=Nodularia sp. UHCC 0506 TaxID=3110243 RepID=UPI002B21528B|nr:hypothetical protein [Nodularia sp. UHCC 0506]MEA5515296.1 hypothetical protein [Nodularia sp. UHCC 0506]
MFKEIFKYVKFAVKSVHTISTALCATICRASWELVAVEMEYLFMGDGNRKRWQVTEDNYDFRYISMSVLSLKREINQSSGGYRFRNTVPR